jgi:hypothetical protein
MKPAHRIIFKTLATYGQSVIGLVLNLFSSRWVLQALGEVDFVLIGVVGGVILLMTFLNGGLALGVDRSYAYSIGREHHLTEEEAVDDLKRSFNTAFSIHPVSDTDGHVLEQINTLPHYKRAKKQTSMNGRMY